MIVSAHGITLEVPGGWSARVFSRSGAVATVHAGDFPLALRDGEFGDRSTGRMPAPGCFLALTEYRSGAGLVPGRGLFSARRAPVRLDPAEFSASRLQHPRPGQLGVQRFFTASGRPFCLYLVVAGPGGHRAGQLRVLERVLSSLRIATVSP